MSSRSSTSTARPAPSRASVPQVSERRTRSAQRGAGTLRRHKETRRAERLAEIRLEVANGTLEVRQMTEREREGGSLAARKTLARNEAHRMLRRAERERAMASSIKGCRER
jgi:hypothetical protein